MNNLDHLQKITTLEELQTRVAEAKAAGKVVVFANGVFDVFHVGHVRYLCAARALGDMLIVAVNDDISTRMNKGPLRPVYPLAERMEILSSLTCVNHLFSFSDPTVERLLETLKPDIHAKGTDYTEETVPERHVVARYGGRVAIVGDPKDHSSTQVIRQTGLGLENHHRDYD